MHVNLYGKLATDPVIQVSWPSERKRKDHAVRCFNHAVARLGWEALDQFVAFPSKEELAGHHCLVSGNLWDTMPCKSQAMQSCLIACVNSGTTRCSEEVQD